MEKLKKQEAFSRAVEAFGDWRTWGRAQHVAYGLIRGVPYVAMEKYANDKPSHYDIARCLIKLGAWPEPKEAEAPRSWWQRLFGKKPDVKVTEVGYEWVRRHQDEVEGLVTWVQKPPRGRRERPVRPAQEAVAG
jgi:hypothetical protein